MKYITEYNKYKDIDPFDEEDWDEYDYIINGKCYWKFDCKHGIVDYDKVNKSSKLLGNMVLLINKLISYKNCDNAIYVSVNTSDNGVGWMPGNAERYFVIWGYEYMGEFNEWLKENNF